MTPACSARRLSTLSTLSFGAVLLVLCAVLPGCRSTDAVRSRMTPVGQQVAVPRGASAAPFGYHQYVPPQAGDTDDPLPLLVFLHGSGERGNGRGELSAVTRHGPPKLIREGRWDRSRPFVVLSPQLAASQDRWPVDSVDAFIDFALDAYRVDPERVYLTGLSLGGHGTWTYAAAHPERIAAAVPVAGDGRKIEATDASYCDLAGVPLWAFHGADDSVVNPRGSIQTVQRLRRCTPPPTPDPRLTVFPGVGHDSWSPTYSSRGRDRPHDPTFDAYDRNLYDWMLQFPREDEP